MSEQHLLANIAALTLKCQAKDKEIHAQDKKIDAQDKKIQAKNATIRKLRQCITVMDKSRALLKTKYQGVTADR